MATAKLENTRMTFLTGGTVLARMTATADTVTFGGDGGSNEVTLTNVKAPVVATDVATKGYVDSLVVSGVTWKNSANVATVSGDMTGSTYDSGTDTITWDGVPTIDGAVIASGNRIVVKDPAVTTGTNSTGIYEFLSLTQFNSSPAVTTPGTGYTGAAGVATTSSGSGTGMIVTTTDDGFGGLASITITTQGSNYLNGDIMTVTGGTGGTFTLSDGELVLTRTADAAAADISNGSAIFVFSGTVNNDKSFVTTNDTSTTWGGGVTFSVMATTPPTAGSDTQVQYNNNNSFGASPNFIFNKNATTPTLTLGASAGGVTTIDMGTSAHPAAINCLGIGGLTVGSAAGVNINCASDGIKLTASGGSGVAWLKSNLSYAEVNGATSASMIGGTSAIVTATTGPATITSSTGTASLLSTLGAIVVTGATTATVTAGSGLAKLVSTSGAAELNGATSASMIGGTSAIVTATTGNVILNGTSNTWTFDGTTVTSAGAFTAQSTTTSNASLISPSGSVILNGNSNNWTFNGTILSSAGDFTARAPSGSNVALFDTTTTGTISIGNTTAGTGVITIAGQNAPITIGSATSSGAIIINNAAAMTVAANSTSVAIGSTNSTTTTVSGQTTTVTATTGTASLVASAGQVVLGTGSFNWTFSTTTMSSSGAFIARAGSSVTLFDTTTTGTISIGNPAAGTGQITIAGSTAAITIGSTSSTTITTKGVSINTGSTETTALNLFARGTSGAIVISAGAVATSGTVNINTVTATTATVAGGAITVAAGGGNTTGAGGALGFTSGAGGATGVGGAITLTAGAGGATSGNGGSVTITAGSAAVSSGGSVIIVPGSGATAGTSGNVTFRLANAGTSTATNNIIEFENSAAAQIARVENTGDMYAATFNTTSDIKYKTNIEQLSDPLNQLKKIEGYSFNWKEDFVGYNDRLQYGVVAQQIEEVGLGHLVTGGNGSSKSVNYIGIIPLLIEAIKELSAKLEKAQIK
jgi:hypothetical protein